jgi:hypothetical protein
MVDIIPFLLKYYSRSFGLNRTFKELHDILKK